MFVLFLYENDHIKYDKYYREIEWLIRKIFIQNKSGRDQEDLPSSIYLSAHIQIHTMVGSAVPRDDLNCPAYLFDTVLFILSLRSYNSPWPCMWMALFMLLQRVHYHTYLHKTSLNLTRLYLLYAIQFLILLVKWVFIQERSPR